MILIYHNPRCSKSRSTLALLRDRGIEPRVIEYLKTPPTAEEMRALAQKLGRPIHECLRTKEAIQHGITLSPDTPESILCAAVAQHPILLERPIVVNGERAAFGRPPEAVLPLLEA